MGCSAAEDMLAPSYTHLNRLALDMLREVRLLSIRRLLLLAIAALVLLLTACVSVFGDPNWSRSVDSDVVLICPIDRHVAYSLNSNWDAIISHTAEEWENTGRSGALNISELNRRIGFARDAPTQNPFSFRAKARWGKHPPLRPLRLCVSPDIRGAFGNKKDPPTLGISHRLIHAHRPPRHLSTKRLYRPSAVSGQYILYIW